MFSDVHVSKSVQRWRTALILHELEDEMAALRDFAETQKKIAELMGQKQALEAQLCQVRVLRQRQRLNYERVGDYKGAALRTERDRLKAELERLDLVIAPLAVQASKLNNPHWGLMLRTGNDKSHFARQIERYADIYTSRVSNFLHHTPFVYLRSPRGSMPHDPGASAFAPLNEV